MKDESILIIITLVMAGLGGYFGVISGDVLTGSITSVLGYIIGRSHEKWKGDSNNADS